MVRVEYVLIVRVEYGVAIDWQKMAREEAEREREAALSEADGGGERGGLGLGARSDSAHTSSARAPLQTSNEFRGSRPMQFRRAGTSESTSTAAVPPQQVDQPPQPQAPTQTQSGVRQMTMEEKRAMLMSAPPRRR